MLDPRGIVVGGFVLVSALLGLSVTMLVRSADQDRRAIRYAQVVVEEPLGHLGDAIRANAEGESLLQQAVVATGNERNTLLSRSLAAREAATGAWTSYRSSSMGLPGEAELAATYERHFAAGKAITGSVLLPIIDSNTPTVLPIEHITAAERDRQSLIALQDIYEREDQTALASLDHQRASEHSVVLIGGSAVAVLLLVGFGFELRVARHAVTDRRTRATLAELTEFEGRLIRALEFADNDDDAFRVASRALVDTRPDAAVSIVAADAGQATLTPIGEAPSCGVERVAQCRVCRSGVPLQFSDSGAIDTCPVLATGAATPCSVTCVPVSIAGMRAAVVQLTGPVGTPPDMTVAVPLIVRRLGDRITTMRALSRFQLQASHDPLTGLLNRRSLEESVGGLTADDTPYAVAFADLDHFKLLNDVHGHDVGDRALRAFATMLKTSLRPDDLVGRWGGEEFVVVLPGCDQQQAIEAMDRVRAQLGSEALEGSTVTVSVGVAVRDPAEAFDQAVARADQALHVAKTTGRNRVEAWQVDPPDAAAAGGEETARDRSLREEGRRRAAVKVDVS
ncbi:MAG: GGDEF domain-containing protein [Actinobacteria bacterium]|nr:GGDEF domain-containing protein [Actinomycetota bacterium]